MTARPAVPPGARPESLTRGWLTDALRAAGRLDADADVASVATTPVGTGQVGDSYRLTITYRPDGAGPPTLVAKLPAADPTSRASAASFRTYETEVGFYGTFAADLPVRTPDALYAERDPATDDFVLLMEDLAPARQGDQIAGCDAEAAAAALFELAGLHGPRWGDPSLADIGWLNRSSDAESAAFAELLPVLHDGFVDRYADRLSDEARSVGGALMDRLEGFLGLRAAGPQTIAHGDFRLDNLLFGTTDGRVAVVDWQTVRLGIGAGDLSYFIGAGLLPDVRRDAEDDLVAGYHRALCDHGVVDYSLDQLRHDYARTALGGYGMAFTASMVVERTDRGDDMFMAMAERHARHALDLGTLDLL